MEASAFMVQPTYLDFESFDFIPYVVIHQLLITKSFTLKAEAKDDWNSFGGIEKVCGLSSTNEELPVSPEQTFIVDDSELVDATPGDYNVIIGYFLNGSEDNDMLITSPAMISPATGGTKAMLAGAGRPEDFSSPSVCGVRGTSSEYRTFR